MDGSIQVEYRGSSANDEFIDSWDSDCGLAESEFAPPVAGHAGPPLVRLTPSPFRSFGDYFNYEGWPDRQRFMELDEALRRRVRENSRNFETTPCCPNTSSGRAPRNHFRIPRRAGRSVSQAAPCGQSTLPEPALHVGTWQMAKVCASDRNDEHNLSSARG